ncbi:MAG TPA: alpha/beta hydrolase [Leptospiraceae bacterium]|nr:lipase [Spirochaetaceae bacterium]HBS05035.1 alpha/beta hydrolase [Leptospiraceae bacterium]|tara:strand:+ start:18560 stop:19615 length:1056 start_codon:yes stop_codon:yes gene_type:complete
MAGWIQRLEGKTGRAILSLPEPVLRFFSGGATRNDAGNILDARIQMGLMLSRIHEAAENLSPVEARKQLSNLLGHFELLPQPVARIENLSIPGPNNRRIKLRLYSATCEAGLQPAMLYFHGGGFVIGDLNTNDSMLRALAIQSGLIIISVDYRLAPEHPYPAGAEDALASYRWVLEHGHNLGIDSSRLGLGGDSAGGNLCLNVSFNAKKKRIQKPAFQSLIYPWVDLGNSAIADSSMIELAEGYGLTGTLLDYFRRHAFSHDTDFESYIVSPCHAKKSDLKALPPTFIQVCGFDPLRDQGLRLGNLMQDAGASVQTRIYEGLIHGATNLARSVPEARELISDMGVFIQEMA